MRRPAPGAYTGGIKENEGARDGGGWQLSVFYEAVSEPQSEGEDEWASEFEKLVKWLEAKPDSLAAAVAEAKAWTGYAWFARGGGWASTVTEDGWRLFRERLAKARAVLEAAGKAHGADADALPPEFYHVMQTVALGQQWDHLEYETWFDRAVRAAPDYDPLYVSKAYFLLPRWYGGPGEWEAFAWEAGHHQGADLYARICCAQQRFFDAAAFFSQDRARWPFLQEGFSKIDAAYPLSPHLVNQYAFFACAAGDKAAARKLLSWIGERSDVHVWGSRDAFEKARAQALSPWPSFSETPRWIAVAAGAVALQAGLLVLFLRWGRRSPKGVALPPQNP